MTYDTTNTDRLREPRPIWKLLDQLAKKGKIGEPKFKKPSLPDALRRPR